LGQAAHTAAGPSAEWRQEWEAHVLDVLRSGKWCRAGGGGQVPEFESTWAKFLGAKRCLATSSGTTALITSLHVVGVTRRRSHRSPSRSTRLQRDPTQKALPVFSDTDPETLTMDPASIESRITERTRAILPVHIYGMPLRHDAINPIAKKRKLAVVEDASRRTCGIQRPQVRTLGDLGCFSFQNSKHMPAGEAARSSA